MRTTRSARLRFLGAVTLTACLLASCATTTDGVALSGTAPAGPQQSTPVQGGSLYTQPELPAAKAISGIQYKPEPNHLHTEGVVRYDTSPPTGGNHSPIWAPCDGAVYNHQLANENAVHMLEHGTVWITYNAKTISAADLVALKKIVDGVDYLALTPYAGLKTPISLQAWNYQLFVTHASDPRVAAFIAALKFPSTNTPEPGGSCADVGFVAAQSTPGHPYNG